MNAVPETLTILANEHAANLARLDDKADEVGQNPDRGLGFAWAVANSLIGRLRNLSASLTKAAAQDRAELVREVADCRWDGNEDELCDEWSFVPCDYIADKLAVEWREALGKLPESLAEALWPLIEEMCPPDEVAEIIHARIAERTVEEVEYDPTPDPDHTYLLGEVA